MSILRWRPTNASNAMRTFTGSSSQTLTALRLVPSATTPPSGNHLSSTTSGVPASPWQELMNAYVVRLATPLDDHSRGKLCSSTSQPRKSAPLVTPPLKHKLLPVSGSDQRAAMHRIAAKNEGRKRFGQVE